MAGLDRMVYKNVHNVSVLLLIIHSILTDSQVLACCPDSYLLQVNNMFQRSFPAINHCDVSVLFPLMLVINQLLDFIIQFTVCT